MKLMRFCLILLIFVGQVQARQLEGVEFKQQVLLADAPVPLNLNGLGIRYKFFFKIYIAALYVEHVSKNADEVINTGGAKRIQMHFLYDEVSKEKLVNGWLEGFENNLSKEQFNALKPRIEKFNAMFETMKQGEVIHLDYIPGSGTAVIIRGQQKGIVPGEDFNRALLNIWLGDYPVGEDLKQSLLGSVE